MQTPRTRRLAAFLSPALLAAGTFAQTAPAPADTADETIVLSPFTVNTQKDRGYASSNSLGGSRMSIPIGELSQTVVVLNDQFLKDRGAIDITEAMNFVAGVQRGADMHPGQEQYSLRGYTVGGTGLRDGLPEPFAAADQTFDEGSGYERIEVIKGPAGTLYGQQSLGGVINKVSKWPKYKQETKTEFSAQSSDKFIRAMVDSTGPLTDKLAYRVVLSARNGDRFYKEGDAPNDFYNTNVAMTYLLGPRGNGGKVWFRGQYLDFSLDREQGLQFITGYLNPASSSTAPVVNNPKFAVPVDFNGAPEDDISKGKIYGLELGFEKLFRMFDGDWTLRLVGRDSDGRGDKSPSYSQSRPVPVDSTGAIVKYTNAGGVPTNGDNRFIAADDPRVADWRVVQTVRDFRGYNEGRGLFADLVGIFRTGPLSHKLVLSATAQALESERAFFFWAAKNPDNTTAVANSFSAITPTPASLTAESIKSSGATKQFNNFNGHVESQRYSYSFQDNVGVFSDRVIFALGARHDIVDSTTDRFNSAQSIAQDRFVIDPTLRTVAPTIEANTFKYGVVVKAVDGLSVYAQHNETFNAVTSLNTAGEKNPDQDGTNNEVGLKLELFGARVVGTVSYFKMELSNVLVSVPNPPELGGGTVLVPVGVQKTDGYEADLAIEPLPGLNMMVAYSNIDSRDELGRWFRGSPINANYSLFARYGFRGGPLQGGFLGGGWKHYGISPGDAANTFFLPESDQFDAFVGYQRKNWTLQLNVYNLTDSQDMLSTVSDTIALRALPRSLRLTMRYSF